MISKIIALVVLCVIGIASLNTSIVVRVCSFFDTLPVNKYEFNDDDRSNDD